MAEREGFEPSIPLQVYPPSKRAHSTTMRSLLIFSGGSGSRETQTSLARPCGLAFTPLGFLKSRRVPRDFVFVHKFFDLSSFFCNQFFHEFSVFCWILEQGALCADADLKLHRFSSFWINELFRGKVRVITASGFAVGMADVVSDLGALAAELAYL